MGPRRLVALVAVLVLATGAVAGTLAWRAHDAAASTECTSLLHPDHTVDFVADLPRQARQSMVTFDDVRPASRARRDALYAHRYRAVVESPGGDAVPDVGVCTATYSGPGHRPSPAAHRRGARVTAVDHVAAILLVHHDRAWTQQCYGPGDACNRGPLRDVTCLAFYDATTLASLGKGWCFDDAAT
ncbi:hypothetical protein [Nocardioides sp. LS1]|uniref:hypothetical protein n=1 Tax=Nocardioides sp. LS1 TaxID=1027620 RepID=UPI000F61A2B1|nr:hypothetical protein [Nocardioides sp. LS1]GCD88927.1 hypothetical protein NLS1_09330 [Nocardioides sp. LS1]